jgi:hypothetical protein
MLTLMCACRRVPVLTSFVPDGMLSISRRLPVQIKSKGVSRHTAGPAFWLPQLTSGTVWFKPHGSDLMQVDADQLLKGETYQGPRQH